MLFVWAAARVGSVYFQRADPLDGERPVRGVSWTASERPALTHSLRRSSARYSIPKALSTSVETISSLMPLTPMRQLLFALKARF
jgi:hypothetical protein